MHVCYTDIIDLRQKLPYMLICGPSIVTGEVCKIEHPKSSQVRDRIEIIRVLMVYSSAPLWCETKFSQSPYDLFPNALYHSPVVV
jgi:hypothetical protein